MTGQEINCSEMPVFDAIDNFALSYMVELTATDSDPNATPRAFRLESIAKALDPLSDEYAHPNQPAPDSLAVLHDALVEPVRSYHDDVTTGGPGRGGRPLIFSAEPPDDSFEERCVTLLRPNTIEYRAEGRRMIVGRGDKTEGRRRISLGFRDAFCAFESGRLFYLISFVPATGDDRLDEYALIALEKLASPKPDAKRYVESWLFGYAGAERTLPDMISERLQRLSRSPDPLPNGLRDVVRQRLFGGDYAPPNVTRKNLRSLLVSIEDETLLGYADAAHQLREDFRIEVPAKRPSDSARKADIRHWHRDENELPGYRPYLALAGILQSVIDFPYQDPSELFDSTRPVLAGHGFFTYAHPDFTIQIGGDWRSLHDARPCLGTCPYLFLMWIVAVHDELMVTEIEEAIDRLIYGKDEAALTAEPLAELAHAMHAISNPFGSPTDQLRDNLRERFQLFRRYSINQSHYLFRYPKEKKALAAIEQGMGTADRFKRGLETIDRLESLVEDVHAMNAVYTSERMGRMIGIITVLGVISFYADLVKNGREMMRQSTWVDGGFALLVVLLVALVFWPEIRARTIGRYDKRSRNVSQPNSRTS